MFLPPVSSLLSPPSSLLVPLSSRPLFAKMIHWYLRHPAWVPWDLSLHSPSLGFMSSRDSSGRSVPCIAVHCIALHCFASHVHLYWSVLHIALVHTALLCLELYCIALPCICFAHFCLQCCARFCLQSCVLHCPRIQFPWQSVAVHCRCMDCIPFIALHGIVTKRLCWDSSLLGPRCRDLCISCSSRSWVTNY